MTRNKPYPDLMNTNAYVNFSVIQFQLHLTICNKKVRQHFPDYENGGENQAIGVINITRESLFFVFLFVCLFF